jgi:hypothetical protein
MMKPAEYMTVAPRVGGMVRRPPHEGGALVKDGQTLTVPVNSYWLRRLAAGDVVKRDPPTIASSFVAPPVEASTVDAAPVEPTTPARRAARKE